MEQAQSQLPPGWIRIIEFHTRDVDGSFIVTTHCPGNPKLDDYYRSQPPRRYRTHDGNFPVMQITVPPKEE